MNGNLPRYCFVAEKRTTYFQYFTIFNINKERNVFNVLQENNVKRKPPEGAIVL